MFQLKGQVDWSVSVRLLTGLYLFLASLYWMLSVASSHFSSAFYFHVVCFHVLVSCYLFVHHLLRWHNGNNDLYYIITRKCLSITAVLHNHFLPKTFFEHGYRKCMFDWLSTYQHITHVLTEKSITTSLEASSGLYCGMLVVVTPDMIRQLMVCTAQSFFTLFIFICPQSILVTYS